jgi:hypothetical protein
MLPSMFCSRKHLRGLLVDVPDTVRRSRTNLVASWEFASMHTLALLGFADTMSGRCVSDRKRNL